MQNDEKEKRVIKITNKDINKTRIPIKPGEEVIIIVKNEKTAPSN